MTTEHQTTPEEEAYWQLREEKEEKLSEAARTLLDKAQSTAYAENLIRTHSFNPEEYEEEMEQMRLAAAQLTTRDCELLAKLWRAALAAASSIDPDDETPAAAGYKVDRGAVHWYWRVASGMVEDILREKASEEFDKKRLEWEDPEDCLDDLF